MPTTRSNTVSASSRRVEYAGIFFDRATVEELVAGYGQSSLLTCPVERPHMTVAYHLNDSTVDALLPYCRRCFCVTVDSFVSNGVNQGFHVTSITCEDSGDREDTSDAIQELFQRITVLHITTSVDGVHGRPEDTGMLFAPVYQPFIDIVTLTGYVDMIVS